MDVYQVFLSARNTSGDVPEGSLCREWRTTWWWPRVQHSHGRRRAEARIGLLLFAGMTKSCARDPLYATQSVKNCVVVVPRNNSNKERPRRGIMSVRTKTCILFDAACFPVQQKEQVNVRTVGRAIVVVCLNCVPSAPATSLHNSKKEKVNAKVSSRAEAARKLTRRARPQKSKRVFS